MSGDLILPHDSYPVQGNTNKAVSYETQTCERDFGIPRIS